MKPTQLSTSRLSAARAEIENFPHAKYKSFSRVERGSALGAVSVPAPLFRACQEAFVAPWRKEVGGVSELAAVVKQ